MQFPPPNTHIQITLCEERIRAILISETGRYLMFSLFIGKQKHVFLQGKRADKQLFPAEPANASSLGMLAYIRPQEWDTEIYRQVA